MHLLVSLNMLQVMHGFKNLKQLFNTMTNCFEKSNYIAMFAKYGCSKYEKSKKTMRAVKTLYARCVRAVNTP